MRRFLFLVACLLSSGCIQASSISFDCPCKQHPKPPGIQNCQAWFNCGCGGVVGDTDEIPPDQD